MASDLLYLVMKQHEQATRLVSMNEAIEDWLERQEGRLHGKRFRGRRSHQVRYSHETDSRRDNA